MKAIWIKTRRSSMCWGWKKKTTI